MKQVIGRGRFMMRDVVTGMLGYMKVIWVLRHGTSFSASCVPLFFMAEMQHEYSE